MSSRTILHTFVEGGLARGMFQRNGARNALVRRYVAGDQLSDALQRVKKLHNEGILSEINYIASDLILDEEIERAVKNQLNAITGVSTFYPNTSICVTLSSIGLLKSVDLARQNLRRIVDAAHERGDIRVRVAMETSESIQTTLDLIREMHAVAPIMRATIQSNLRRSDHDIGILNAAKIPILLVKGAYSDTPMVTYTLQADIDRQFRKQMFRLLGEGISPAIATHDPQLIADAKLFAKKEALPTSDFELDLWMGVAPKLQTQLAMDSYRVRTTVSFGEAWYSYFTDRVAAKTGNLPVLLKGLVGGEVSAK